jgi:hypothetical protein
LRIGEPRIEPALVPAEAGLRKAWRIKAWRIKAWRIKAWRIKAWRIKAWRIMEALDLAGWPAEDLDQRRALPGSVGETGRVASGALLLEERGPIE